MAANEPSKPPTLGLLTRTLVGSPVIKWIIPARVRHRSKNDVLFIRDRTVQIKQIHVEGDLGKGTYVEDIAAKDDFDSSIRAARILGSPRMFEADKPRKTGVDAIVKQEEMDLSEDEIILRPELPPHILALTLESMKLVFLCAYHHDREVHFLASHRQLPSSRTYSEQLGEHLAVDPKSRALAVAANEGSFYFYALKPMEDLKRAVESGHDRLQDERFDPVVGVGLRLAHHHNMLTIESRKEGFQ